MAIDICEFYLSSRTTTHFDVTYQKGQNTCTVKCRREPSTVINIKKKTNKILLLLKYLEQRRPERFEVNFLAQMDHESGT